MPINYNQNCTYLIIQIQAKQMHLNEVLSAIYDSIAPTHKEEGCLEYKLMHNKNSVVIIGRWKNQMALDMHLLLQFHLNLFEKILPPLCDTIHINSYKEVEPPITALSVL